MQVAPRIIFPKNNDGCSQTTNTGATINDTHPQATETTNDTSVTQTEVETQTDVTTSIADEMNQIQPNCKDDEDVSSILWICVGVLATVLCLWFIANVVCVVICLTWKKQRKYEIRCNPSYAITSPVYNIDEHIYDIPE